MAISFAQVSTPARTAAVGDRVVVTTDFTGDASYPTGGYLVTPQTFGLDSIDMLQIELKPVAAAGVAYYDASNGGLKFYTTLTGTEVVNGTSLTTVTGRLTVQGKGRASFSTV